IAVKFGDFGPKADGFERGVNGFEESASRGQNQREVAIGGGIVFGLSGLAKSVGGAVEAAGAEFGGAALQVRAERAVVAIIHAALVDSGHGSGSGVVDHIAGLFVIDPLNGFEGFIGGGVAWGVDFHLDCAGSVAGKGVYDFALGVDEVYVGEVGRKAKGRKAVRGA